MNIDDIRYIRDQITDKSVRDEIDEYITDQSIVLTGPSKGFMLFLRRVICCLHSADKSTKTEAYKKLHPTADEQDDVRSTILLPIVSEINRKIQSLPPSEAIALKKLPFVVPGDVFSSYPTFGKFLEQTAHCSEGLVGQLVDFYNFNKRKYFTNDDTVIGINRNLGCSAAFLDSYCRSSNDPFNTSSRINNSNITAANLNSYSTQTNSNNDSKNYMINMSKAGKNVLGGKKTQRKRKNKRQTKRR